MLVHIFKEIQMEEFSNFIYFKFCFILGYTQPCPGVTTTASALRSDFWQARGIIRDRSNPGRPHARQEPYLLCPFCATPRMFIFKFFYFHSYFLSQSQHICIESNEVHSISLQAANVAPTGRPTV